MTTQEQKAEDIHCIVELCWEFDATDGLDKATKQVLLRLQQEAGYMTLWDDERKRAANRDDNV